MKHRWPGFIKDGDVWNHEGLHLIMQGDVFLVADIEGTRVKVFFAPLGIALANYHEVLRTCMRIGR